MQRDPWHNDFPMEPARVAEVIAADLPDFADSRVAVLGEGWDFTTFLVDDEWVFRFPKRRQYARKLAREFKMLEALAAPLAPQTIAIPRYRYHVQAPVLSKVPYVGYALLPGEPLVDCPADSLDSAAHRPSTRRVPAAPAIHRADAKATHVPRSVSIRPHRLPA